MAGYDAAWTSLPPEVPWPGDSKTRPFQKKQGTEQPLDSLHTPHGLPGEQALGNSTDQAPESMMHCLNQPLRTEEALSRQAQQIHAEHHD